MVENTGRNAEIIKKIARESFEKKKLWSVLTSILLKHIFKINNHFRFLISEKSDASMLILIQSVMDVGKNWVSFTTNACLLPIKHTYFLLMNSLTNL